MSEREDSTEQPAVAGHLGGPEEATAAPNQPAEPAAPYQPYPQYGPAEPVTPYGGAEPVAPAEAAAPYGGAEAPYQPDPQYGPVPPHEQYSPVPPSSAPAGGGRTGKGLAAVAMVGLMVVSAVGGGIAGASIYAYTQDSGGNGAGAARVVDAPQLDYTSLASISSQVAPSVVSIRIGRFGGSGVVISPDGYIITNSHVVEVAQGDQVEVRFSNGDVVPAAIVGTDWQSDIAVIRVDGVDGLTPAPIADSNDVLIGDTVLALGSPLGYDGTVTQGIVSGLNRTLRPDDPSAPTLSGLLQTDAAINRGNSGGALVNLAGEVVGINTAIAVDDDANGFLGLGFAVPSNRAMEVADALIAGDEIGHAFLGVGVTRAEGGGALLTQVLPDSPAADAGLAEGDVVIRFGDTPIADDSDLVAAVQGAEPGETLEVEYRRGDTTATTEVTLAEAPGRP